MGIDTFPFLQNHTHLIEHRDTIYKLKLVYEGVSTERRTALSETIPETSAHSQIEDVFRAVLYSVEREECLRPVQTEHFVVLPQTVQWSLGQKVMFRIGKRKLRCHKELILFKIAVKNDLSTNQEGKGHGTMDSVRQRNHDNAPNLSQRARAVENVSKEDMVENSNHKSKHPSTTHVSPRIHTASTTSGIFRTPGLSNNRVNNEGSLSPKVRGGLNKILRIETRNNQRNQNLPMNPDNILSSSEEESLEDSNCSGRTPRRCALRAQMNIKRISDKVENTDSQNSWSEVIESSSDDHSLSLDSDTRKVNASKNKGRSRISATSSPDIHPHRLRNKSSNNKKSGDMLQGTSTSKVQVEGFRDSEKSLNITNKQEVLDPTSLNLVMSRWLESSKSGREQSRPSRIISPVKQNKMNAQKKRNHLMTKSGQENTKHASLKVADLIKKYRYETSQQKCSKQRQPPNNEDVQSRPQDDSPEAGSTTATKDIASDFPAVTGKTQENNGFEMSDKDVVEICDDGSVIYESEVFDKGDGVDTVTDGRGIKQKRRGKTITRGKRRHRNIQSEKSNMITPRQPRGRLRKGGSDGSGSSADTIMDSVPHQISKTRSLDEETQAADSSSPEQKRGRGRSRKTSEVISNGNETSPDTSFTISRKRGGTKVIYSSADDKERRGRSSSGSVSPVRKKGRSRKQENMEPGNLENDRDGSIAKKRSGSSQNEYQAFNHSNLESNNKRTIRYYSSRLGSQPSGNSTDGRSFGKGVTKKLSPQKVHYKRESKSGTKLRQISNKLKGNRQGPTFSDSPQSKLSQISSGSTKSERSARLSHSAHIQARKTDTTRRTKRSQSASPVSSLRSGKDRKGNPSQKASTPTSLQEARERLLAAKDGVWLSGRGGKARGSPQVSTDRLCVRGSENENLVKDRAHILHQRFSCPLSPIPHIGHSAQYSLCQDLEPCSQEVLRMGHIPNQQRKPHHRESRFFALLNSWFGK